MAVRTAWSKRDGLTEDKLSLVSEFDSHEDLFTDRERAALSYTRSFCYNVGWVDDDSLATVGRYFSPAEIVELTFCLWQFMGGNMFLHALGVEPEGDLSEYYGGLLDAYGQESRAPQGAAPDSSAR